MKTTIERLTKADIGKRCNVVVDRASDTAREAGLPHLAKHCEGAMRSLTEAELECPAANH